jgi:hypothetical protein
VQADPAQICRPGSGPQQPPISERTDVDEALARIETELRGIAAAAGVDIDHILKPKPEAPTDDVK